MTLGEKLSRLRRKNNYTQEQLADILDVSRQAISKWESDVAYPETDKLIRLSTLFRCSVDYLVKEDVEQPNTQTVEPRERSEKATLLWRGILRFAPGVLYSLWALLLWAFYVPSFVKGSDYNLYQWFGHRVIVELQPTINALISLGVISCAYIAALWVLQRFGSKKANLIANICSFVFQVAVFVCVMSLIGVAKSVGLKCGKVVVVVATLTGVFALLQAVFMALDRYFYHDEKVDLTPKRTIAFVHKSAKFIGAHKVAAIVTACVLLVGVALSVVLPLTVGNVFRTSRVAKIELGDSRDEVRRILGKPTDIGADDLAELIDGSLSVSNQDLYMYFPRKVAKVFKDLLRAADDAMRVSAADDAMVLYAKLDKMYKDLKKMEFPYIGVYYENGQVVAVEFNAKFSMERMNDVKWNVGGKKRQSIQFIPDVIPYGQTPYSVELIAKVFYSDGSYRYAQLDDFSAVSNAYTSGWTIEWSDDWGSYARSIRESVDKGNVVSRGEWQEGVNYIIENASVDGIDGYTLRIMTHGESNINTALDFANYRDKIVEITVDDGVKQLPDGVFANFSGLVSVELPDSLVSIGNRAFYNCVSLESITIPNSVTTLGVGVFDGCASLQNISLSQGIRTISDYAFANCTALREITIPYAIEKIGKYAFANCTELAEVTFAQGGRLSMIDDYAFTNCGFTEVTLGNYAYGNYVYANSTKITDVYVANPKQIGQSILEGCGVTLRFTVDGMTGIANLSQGATIDSVAFERGVTTVPAELFKNNGNLQSVQFASTVTSIGKSAFENCKALTTVTFENGNGGNLLTIGEMAFAYCNGIQSFTVPNHVTKIGDRAFYYCVNLRNLNFEEGSANLTIGQAAFLNCTGLTELVFPNRVYSIQMFAFQDCSNVTSIWFDVNSSRLYELQRSAFQHMDGLVSVKLPLSLKSPNCGNAFTYCDRLVEIWGDVSLASVFSQVKHFYSGNESSWIVEKGDYKFFEDKTVAPTQFWLVDYTGESKELTLPKDYNGAAYSIWEQCFYNADVISLTWEPTQGGSIGRYAFYQSTLTSVILRNIDTIGDYAFSAGDIESALTGAVLDAVNIGQHAFEGNTRLTNLELSNRVRKIYDYAFFGCVSVAEIQFSDSSQLEYLGEFCFGECFSLTSFYVPASVIRIESFVFAECYKLTDVVFANTEGWFRGGVATQDVENSKLMAEEMRDPVASYTYYTDKNYRP